MALFTIIMGNAFAAFPVMTAGIGLPLLIGQHHADAAALGALGMLCGYCGTLLTPMAANYNIVPVALLELRDPNGVIRAQWPTAVVPVRGEPAADGLSCLPMNTRLTPLHCSPVSSLSTGESVNPSQEIARALDASAIAGHRVVGAALPTEFARALPALVALIQAASSRTRPRHRPGRRTRAEFRWSASPST